MSYEVVKIKIFLHDRRRRLIARVASQHQRNSKIWLFPKKDYFLFIRRKIPGAANGRIPRSGEAGGVVAGTEVVPVVAGAVGVEGVVAAGVCSGATVTASVSPGDSPATEALFFCVKTTKYEKPGEVAR